MWSASHAHPQPGSRASARRGHGPSFRLRFPQRVRDVSACGSYQPKLCAVKGQGARFYSERHLYMCCLLRPFLGSNRKLENRTHSFRVLLGNACFGLSVTVPYTFPWLARRWCLVTLRPFRKNTCPIAALRSHAHLEPLWVPESLFSLNFFFFGNNPSGRY